MKNNTNCEVIRDLLPIYVDNLTSDASNQLISDHLENCIECKNISEELSKNISVDVSSTKKEVNYLKKLKRKNIIIAASCIFICLVLGSIAGYVNHYYHGVPAVAVPVDEVKVLGTSLNKDGTVMCKVAATSDYEVRGLSVKREGDIYYITFYSVRKPNKRVDGNKYANIMEENIGYSPDGNLPISKVYYRDANDDLLLVWESK